MNYLCKKSGWVAIALSLGLITFWTQAQTITKASWIQSIENQRIYFDTAKTSLNAQTREQLAEVVGRLGQLYGDFAIEVTGHTDSQGDADLNLKISQLRALAVVDYLSRHNVHHHRYLIQSKGEYVPLASNESEEGRSLNRRVELKIVAQDFNAISLLGGTQRQTDVETQGWAQLGVDPQNEPETLSDESVIDEMPIEEQLLDDAQVEDDLDTQVTEEQMDTVSETDDFAPLEAPLQSPPSPKKDASTQYAPEDRSINGHDVKYREPYSSDDYYISSDDGKIKLREKHTYDLRKKPGKGTLQVLVGAEWAKLKNLQDSGVAASSQKSDPSFLARLRWISLMEDNENIFVGLGGFARWTRFSQNAAAGFAQDENEWSFGGQVIAGVFITPNVSLMLDAGYESYLYVRPSGVNLRLDNDYVVRVGPSMEAVVWRFSPLGDVGFGLHGSYMDFGQGEVKSGWSYGANLFVDYSLFRLGFEWNQIELDTDYADINYQNWNLTASVFY